MADTARQRTFVTGVIGADTHIVGNRILSMGLERAGYRIVSLGALTPASDFISAAIETADDAILVSSLYGQGELDCRGFRHAMAQWARQRIGVGGQIGRMACFPSDPICSYRPMKLRTERLAIRPFTLDDAPFIMELVNDPAWLRFIGDKAVQCEADARRYLISGPLAMYANHGLGLCAVEQIADGRTVGMCGLIRREGLDDVDIGFAFLPQARRQGFATEAARAVIADGVARHGITKIVAITDPDNVASARVLEALGFRFDRAILVPGNTEVLCWWSAEARSASLGQHKLRGSN